VSAGIFSTPRAVPSRIGPTVAGATVIALVLVIVTVSNESVGLSAALLYAVAFTIELGVGLATYFGAEGKA
jgi:hypothetical protein